MEDYSSHQLKNMLINSTAVVGCPPHVCGDAASNPERLNKVCLKKLEPVSKGLPFKNYLNNVKG